MQRNSFPHNNIRPNFRILERLGWKTLEIRGRRKAGTGWWELQRGEVSISCVFYLAICILKRSKSISVAQKDEFRGTHTLALGKSCPNFWEDACLFFRNSPGFAHPQLSLPPFLGLEYPSSFNKFILGA